MKKIQMKIPQEQIIAFCTKWNIRELALFGSVLHENFGPDSDVDVLVTFSPDAKHTLFDMARMQEELESILARDVDIISRRGVEHSRNPMRRDAILNSAETIYAA